MELRISWMVHNEPDTLFELFVYIHSYGTFFSCTLLLKALVLPVTLHSFRIQMILIEMVF